MLLAMWGRRTCVAAARSSLPGCLHAAPGGRKSAFTVKSLASPILLRPPSRLFRPPSLVNSCSSPRPVLPARRGIKGLSSAASDTPPVAVVDGMTRYPEFTSVRGLLRASDYFGTVIFAISGSVTAGMAGMDLLGCTVVGTITAVGGGTIRDLLIGNSPVFWMVETEYLWMCLAATAATFFGWKALEEQHGITEDHPVLVWGDALGVGAFAVIGCQNGLRKGLPAIICVVCGVCTATFGGMTRDVLCRRPPRILHSKAEIYATTAAVGAGSYVLVRSLGAPLPLRIAAGVSTAITARYLAWTHGIRLPAFQSVQLAAAVTDATAEP